MADFCRQCSEKVFGQDYGDMRGLCDPGYLVVVLCEGCGAVQVDHEGRCVSEDCLEKHGEKNAQD
jgi:hypothetical protein